MSKKEDGWIRGYGLTNPDGVFTGSGLNVKSLLLVLNSCYNLTVQGNMVLDHNFV